MKKQILLWAILVLLVASNGAVMAKNTKQSECTSINSGEISDQFGNPLQMGFDEFGYNYQAHMFDGRHCDTDRVLVGSTCDIRLKMKWSESFLSNNDCNGDGFLDAKYEPGSWLTNHQWGSYEQNGETCEWSHFLKMIVKPTTDYDCTENGGIDYGIFCKIMVVHNDPCGGLHGMKFTADPPGLGYYK